MAWHLKLPRSLWGRKAPLQEQAPAQGLTNALGKLSLYAAPLDPPPGGDASYRRMTHDPQVKACLDTKKFAVLSRGWEVHPASDSAEDVRTADFCRWALSNMDGSILDAGYDVLDALAFGISLCEINYRLLDTGPWHGFIGLANIKPKDIRHFTIRTDEFYNVKALRLAAGTELDPAKFLLYTYMPRYGNPYGEADLRAAYQSWYAKYQILTWWNKYLEKFGIPTVVGSYAAKAGYTQAQQLAFLTQISQIQNESGLVVPDDLKLELLQSTNSAAPGATFDELVSYHDRAIAKSILGQTLTTDSTARGATYALGAVHFDVLRFYINKLTRDLEGVMMYQLLGRLVGFNFPPGTATPLFKFGKIDDDRLAVVGTLISQLITGQVIAPDEPWIRSYLGLPAATAEAA
jgi:phage gp29-like protein